MDDSSCPDESKVCMFWAPGIAHICLDTCDPLWDECDPGLLCAPDWAVGAERFVCVAEYSGAEGQEFDPCIYGNECDPGHICSYSSAAVECDPGSDGCCLAYCDLDEPQCNGAGAECVSFYGQFEGMPPSEHADVGVCMLPG